MVDVQLALEVVAFVLYDACQKAFDFLAVRLEVLVEPFQGYVFHPRHVFGDSGEAKAAFAARYGRLVENFDFGVDECHLAACAFREAVAHGVGVDDHKAYVAADLRSRQPHTLAEVHGVEHLCHQLFKLGILRAYRLGYGAQHGVAIEVDGKFHYLLRILSR